MKTQKEMIELLAESGHAQVLGVDEEMYDDAQDLRNFIFDRCMDGANVLDYIALAIDQRGKEDGINLIDEILTSLIELPPDAEEEDVYKMKNALCSLSIGVEYDHIPDEFKGKFDIPYGDTDQIEMASFNYPIKSIDHLIEQIMDMKRVTPGDKIYQKP